ncbi:MAG: protein kinase [Opitutaceae bacterium]
MSNPPASPEPSSIRETADPGPSIPDYELVRVVGRGSYGDVWLARSVTGAWRAIKVVWRDRFSNPEPFEREFRGLKEFTEFSLGESLQMALLHVGRNDASGFFYYVMELADDADRDRHIDPSTYVPLTLAELRSRRGRIAAGECARYGVELARVLASLHRRGLVHRDIKPSNIILVAGVPKLADIGLVAPSGSANTFVGTEGYVPSEGPGSPSADVFALGKVLYELSTGHDRQEFPKLPIDLDVLPDRSEFLELNEILRRACGPVPAQRYADGAAILADLVALSAGVSLRTRRLTTFLLRVAAGIAVVAALAGAGWYWGVRPGPSAASVAAETSPQSVAVLPFSNLKGDAAQDYFSDGFSEEILNALARERDLRVTGSTSSFSFKGTHLPAAEIARELNVARLVEGSVQRVGSRMRIHVRLTRVADGVTENLGTFDRDATDIFALQDEVARAVVAKITGRPPRQPVAAMTKDLSAYDAFLRGRAASNVTAEEAFYTEAVRRDPDFAVAWARLAEVRFRQTLPAGKPPPSTLAAVQVALDRAFAAQPELPLALTVRGLVRGLADADFAGARVDFNRAEELGGKTTETRLGRVLVAWASGERTGAAERVREAIAADPEPANRQAVIFATLLTCLGEFAEADLFLGRALATNETRHVPLLLIRAHLRWRWRGAEAALRLLARAPEHAKATAWFRAQLLNALGRFDEARSALDAAGPGSIVAEMLDAAGLVGPARAAAESEQAAAQAALERGDRSDRTRSRLISAKIVLGQHESAAADLETWRREVDTRPSIYQRASGMSGRVTVFYARLGQREVAIARLRDETTAGVPAGYWLRDNGDFAPLRNDPRFLELCREAEAWANRQPDPPDDAVATGQR